jgi:hypothetical protein
MQTIRLKNGADARAVRCDQERDEKTMLAKGNLSSAIWLRANAGTRTVFTLHVAD